MERYGVQIKRDPNPDLPLALRRIASKRGQGDPYTVCDLYRDCLLEYTKTHSTYNEVARHNNFVTRTVYVRDMGGESKKFGDLAKTHGITSLGKLLEASVNYCIGDEIAIELVLIAKQRQAMTAVKDALNANAIMGSPHNANTNND